MEDRLLPSLTAVAQANHFPYSAIAQVTAYYDRNHDGKIDGGDAEALATATMIGPNIALTSAHEVYDASLGGLAFQVDITPAENGSSIPLSTFHARAWVVPAVYTNPNAPAAFNMATDVAVLQFDPLQGPSGFIPIGDLTGWLGHAAYTDQSLRRVTVTNIGYPALTYSGVNQYRASGRLISAHEAHGIGLLKFSNRAIPVQPGNSGSPLLRPTPSGPVVIGVIEASYVDLGINVATKITRRVNDFISLAERPQSGGVILPFTFPGRAHTRAFVPASP